MCRCLRHAEKLYRPFADAFTRRGSPGTCSQRWSSVAAVPAFHLHHHRVRPAVVDELQVTVQGFRTVDDDARHRDLSSLESKVDLERKRLEGRRDTAIDERAKKLEQDLETLESEGAKADARRKVKDGAEREMKQLRDRAQREIDRLDEVWSRFKSLKLSLIHI